MDENITLKIKVVTFNRLISVSGPSGLITYAYDGLGDRLQETVNGVTTTFMMDISTSLNASDLTQVLDDGTNEYIYGNDRIEQTSGTDTEYFLPDALDSVRQMTDSNGAVTLARNYDPFGNPDGSLGSATTIFGYSGEQVDPTGMIYLRARDYDPYLNQFIQPDTIVPDQYNPQTLNRYEYAQDNPIRYVDPTGHYNRQAAVDFALQHYRGANLNFESPNNNDCTNYVSYALSAGGITDPRPSPLDPKNSYYYKNESHLKMDMGTRKLEPPIWNADVMSNNPYFTYPNLNFDEWYVTDDLLDFLTTNGLADSVASYNGVIPHFEYGLTTPNANRNNDAWVNYLTTYVPSIQPGDLVFYNFSPRLEPSFQWDHVAFIVGWDYQTYVNDKGEDPWESIARDAYNAFQAGYPFSCSDHQFDYDVNKPRVVEASGILPYHDLRSVDNTDLQVGQVLFVHVR